ncbi:MAG: DUF2147 domain-containing protein [Bacteroidota bacterium]|nr:DUF2147 domain-containing protein [Bacteroidota bacterium]
MKKLIAIITVFFGTATMASASNADDIVGIWLSASGEGKIQIYKEGDRYFGKLYWMKEPNGPKGNPKLDNNNPDPALRNKPLLGLVILKNFRYDDGEWSGGLIYDPKNGKEYKSYIKLKDPQTLSLRGYIGISLLGRTELWKRAG